MKADIRKKISAQKFPERLPSGPVFRFTKQERQMAEEPKQLEDPFHESLKEVYFAEKKILTAEQLGLKDAALLLQETLEEEEATDEALTELAEVAVNSQADARAA